MVFNFHNKRKLQDFWKGKYEMLIQRNVGAEVKLGKFPEDTFLPSLIALFALAMPPPPPLQTTAAALDSICICICICIRICICI